MAYTEINTSCARCFVHLRLQLLEAAPVYTTGGSTQEQSSSCTATRLACRSGSATPRDNEGLTGRTSPEQTWPMPSSIRTRTGTRTGTRSGTQLVLTITGLASIQHLGPPESNMHTKTEKILSSCFNHCFFYLLLRIKRRTDDEIVN